MRLVLIAIALLLINVAAVIFNRPEVFFWIAILSAVLASAAGIDAYLRWSVGSQTETETEKPATPAPAAPKVRDERVDAEIVHFLGLLQQKGRFVDFLMEDVTGFSNEQVGAAARVIHQGCAPLVKEHFVLAPAHEGEEGAKVKLEPGYDSDAYQLTGNVEGSPPFEGTLVHHGWVIQEVKLPRIVDSSRRSSKGLVVAPAEVEIRK